MAKAGGMCRKAVKAAAAQAPGLFKKGEALCASTVCPKGEKLLGSYGVPSVVLGPVGKLCVSACTWAVKKIGSSLAPKLADEQLGDDICKKAGIEEELLEQDTGTQFFTLALYNTISQASELDQQEWGAAGRLAGKVKNAAVAAAGKVKGFVMAKAGGMCRKAVKAAAAQAPGLFKKGEALCASTVCPKGEKLLGSYGVPSVVLGPVGKLCVSACTWAVKKIGSSLAPKLADEQLGDDICKKAGIEEESLLQSVPTQFVATEEMLSAAMTLNIEHASKGRSDAERYISAGLVNDPEFIQTMMKWWNPVAAAKNAYKKVKGAVVAGFNKVKGVVLAGAKKLCPVAVKFGQTHAHAVIAKGGAMCKDVLCPALVTYVTGQTGGVGAFLAPLLKTGCDAACGWAEAKLHDTAAKFVNDPNLPTTLCARLGLGR